MTFLRRTRLYQVGIPALTGSILVVILRDEYVFHSGTGQFKFKSSFGCHASQRSRMIECGDGSYELLAGCRAQEDLNFYHPVCRTSDPVGGCVENGFGVSAGSIFLSACIKIQGIHIAAAFPFAACWSRKKQQKNR